MAAGASSDTASAIAFIVMDCRASLLRMRTLLNGRPVASTTARLQLSRLSSTRLAMLRHTSSASDLSDTRHLPRRGALDERCEALRGPHRDR
ncbi:Uncharacterised protein [Mycobacteroides abscessus subsp. abscessus]|nr:Uncharacterised protein [Mycobacteroides abscessus subsp. abscessus]